MSKSRPATKKDIIEMKRMLTRARNRYDERVYDFEQIWAKVGPYDYEKRSLLLDVTTDLIDIDHSLKEWEQKLF